MQLKERERERERVGEIEVGVSSQSALKFMKCRFRAHERRFARNGCGRKFLATIISPSSRLYRVDYRVVEAGGR